MKGLLARLVVLIAAAVLVGLVVIDVAFVFWQQREYSREAQADLRASLLEVVLDPALVTDPARLVAEVAQRHDEVVSLIDASGAVLASQKVALPSLSDLAMLAQPTDLASFPSTTERVSRTRGSGPVAAGAAAAAAATASKAWLHEVVPVSVGSWRYAVAARPRAQALQGVLAEQPWVATVLLGAGLVILFFATLFLRRTVLAPLRHVTDLVQSHELDGLHALSQQGSSNDLARLGRAIVAMNQTIDDERRRIAMQLDELTTKNAALAHAQQEVVRAERLAVVGQLAAGLAHEVGNPLAILSGYVDMFKSGGIEGDDRQHALTRMGKELDRIHATLRSLLDFSRTKTTVEAGPGDLREALTHVGALLASQLRGVTLDLPALAAPVPVPIATDAATQLVLNLILNAFDAIERRGHVAITVSHDEGGVWLQVDDSGPGVPEALRHRIFEPFFTTKPAGHGTGLGLAVCERIVTDGGGDIHVEPSPLLGGARFCVKFPAVQRSAGI